MKIQLNGTETEIAEGITVAALLKERRLQTENLIVECNGELLDRPETLDTHVLRDGDMLNLFTMVGGG